MLKPTPEVQPTPPIEYIYGDRLHEVQAIQREALGVNIPFIPAEHYADAVDREQKAAQSLRDFAVFSEAEVNNPALKYGASTLRSLRQT